MNALERRLERLERAPEASDLVVRVYASHSDATADGELPGLGETVLAIITGVPRAPGAGAPGSFDTRFTLLKPG